MRRTEKIIKSLFIFFIITLSGISLTNCSKDDPTPATTGKVEGKVTDFINGSALSDVSVITFDASVNSPVFTSKTNATGDFSIDLNEGTYFLKFYKQGYDPVPPQGMEAIPFTVVIGQTITQSAQMLTSKITNAGSISGKVTVGSTAKSGVLVIAEGNGSAYSAVSDNNGNYTIFNVPAASYTVKGFLAAHSSTSVPASTTANTATNNIDVTLTQNATGQVAGTFKVISQTTIATPPAKMDIALIHPITKETIPGLSQSVNYGSSLSYSFSNVPDGTYIVRASYSNDYIVIDPDYITKFGDYKVTLSGGTPTPSAVDIVATSAVILSSPTNAMNSIAPVDATTTPTFQWTAYASTSDYVIEVTDASTGQVIWGGFTNNNGSITKNITIPSNTTSVAFNSDGKALAQLTVGKIYRWRVFASKNNVQTGSWNLIAASEDQVGLIKIK